MDQGKPRELWGWVCQHPDRQRVLRAHLRGVEDADDAGDDGAVLVLVLLADQLDVPQLAEVEIPLLLQPVHCQLQIHQLRADDSVCAEGAVAPRDPPVPLAVPTALPTCWLSSRICASASGPPLRAAGEFFRRMLLGTLLRRAGLCVLLGPVGEVLWGTWGSQRGVG